jgi:high frequency lysogenization protein
MSKQERTLALAGVYQAAELVYQAARHNTVAEEAYQATLGSLLKLDADSTAAVYGTMCGVKLGLTVLATQMHKETKQRNWEMVRYAIELLFLERRLNKNPAMLADIGRRVTVLSKRKTDVTDADMVADLAAIYVDTFGTFNHRIHVQGDPQHLRDAHNVNRIRALLLAGVRSAVLWQQKGGNRLTLMLQRSKYVDTAWALLDECP